MNLTKDISQENLSSLFKDGVYEDLFRLLWSRDELNYGPSINIPDTIIYKYGQPVSWYFTAQNGRVKKKNKHNLVSANIEEVFNKHVLGYDVLAYFITTPSSEQDQNNAITIEYLDRQALNDFLYKRPKDFNGVLQRFIEPKSTRNETIRAIWSPKVCLLERAENIHQLHDHRYGLYERCVIYEGPEYYYTSAPLRGPVLSGQIQKLCESIVDHISEVTFGQKKVSRIVLNFKVDSRDKIWLLYSTSTRSIDMLDTSNEIDSTKRTLLNIDSVIGLSNTVHLNPKKSYNKIIPKTLVRCLSCAKESLEDLRHPVTYKSIIKHYDHVMHLLVETANGTKRDAISWPPDPEIIEAAGGVSFGSMYINDKGELLNQRELEHLHKIKQVKDLQIPCIIQYLHPKLTLKSYLQCKRDPLFLYKTVHVCEPCYLVFAEFTVMLLKLGGNLHKLLTPDPAAEFAINMAVISPPRTTIRPSSAEWRAISSVGGSRTGSVGSIGGSSHGQRAASVGSLARINSGDGGFNPPSANHKNAKNNAIGLRTSDVRLQPDVPKTIRSATDSDLLFALEGGREAVRAQNSPDGQEESAYTRSPSPSRQQLSHLRSNDSVSSLGSSLYYDPEDVKSMIAERERIFFKEIAMNPQLKDQHPLMHMISAQQKLKLADQSSEVTRSNKDPVVFSSKFGTQNGIKGSTNPYAEEQPYILNGEIILPSKLKQRRLEELAKLRREKLERKKSFNVASSGQQPLPYTDDETIGTASLLDVSGDEEQISSKGKLKGSVDSPLDGSGKKSKISKEKTSGVNASIKHREFLIDSLRKIEDELL